jgi:hypothetical protein
MLLAGRLTAHKLVCMIDVTLADVGEKTVTNVLPLPGNDLLNMGREAHKTGADPSG